MQTRLECAKIILENQFDRKEIIRAYHVTHNKQKRKADPVQILVIHDNYPSFGFIPLHFGAQPQENIHYPYMILDLNEEEHKTLILPPEWQHQELIS